MISVLVCTHGPAADGLLQTAEMICGKQEQCVALSFQMGESLDEFKQTVQKRLKQLSADSQSILCLVDLKGGTPFNTVVSLLPEYPNLEIVTGVNVPMLLQTFIQRSNMDLPELLPEVLRAANQGIEQYDAKSITQENSEDEDF